MEANKKNRSVVILTLIGLLAVLSGFYSVIQNETPPPPPRALAAPVPEPTPTSVSWQSYTNVTFGFQLNYPADQPPAEVGTKNFSDTLLANGCFRASAGRQTAVIPETVGITKTQIADLEKLPQGNTLSYTKNDSQYKKSFTKLPPVLISGIEWNTFEVVDPLGRPGTNNLYFTKANKNLYVVSVNHGGECDETVPQQMLSSFTFIQ